jgi:hypothetical protein
VRRAVWVTWTTWALAACGATPPAAPAAEPLGVPARGAHAAPPTVDGLRVARELFAAHEVDAAHEVAGDIVALARDAGLTTSDVRTAVEQVYATCREPDTQRCASSDPIGEPLLALFAELGGATAAPLLSQIHAKGAASESLVTRALRAEMAASVGPCNPPGEAEIARERRRLADFAVFDVVSGELTARPLTTAEADDLAYFMVGVSTAGPPVGESGEGSRPPAPDPPDTEAIARRAELLAEIDAGHARGELEQVAVSARAYLESLGFPSPLRVHEEAEYAWGGARYSYVMRDLAFASEILGDVELARDLYRRADPGGGACGSSTDYRRGEQTLGVIRTAERAGECRDVVAERLMDWDGQSEWFDSPEDRARGYGPERLARAGWDVLRLYRGALTTRNRDLDRADLLSALDRAPEPLRSEARRRFEEAGNEAWERRVHAAEGLADRGGRASLDEVVQLLDRAAAPLAERTLYALGQMASRPVMGRCDEDLGWLMLGGISNVWSRPVRAFGKDCQTALTDAEADVLAQRVSALLTHAELGVGLTAAEALGQIGAPGSIPILDDALARHARMATACPPDDTSPKCWNAKAMQEGVERALDRLRQLRDAARSPAAEAP